MLPENMTSHIFNLSYLILYINKKDLDECRSVCLVAGLVSWPHLAQLESGGWGAPQVKSATGTHTLVTISSVILHLYTLQ